MAAVIKPSVNGESTGIIPLQKDPDKTFYFIVRGQNFASTAKANAPDEVTTPTGQERVWQVDRSIRIDGNRILVAVRFRRVVLGPRFTDDDIGQISVTVTNTDAGGLNPQTSDPVALDVFTIPL